MSFHEPQSLQVKGQLKRIASCASLLDTVCMFLQLSLLPGLEVGCGFLAPAVLNTVCQIHHGVSFTCCSLYFECPGYSLCSINVHLSFEPQHKHFFFLLGILCWTSCVIYLPLFSAMMLCAHLFPSFIMLYYLAALSFLLVISVYCFIRVYCQLNSKGQWWCLIIFIFLLSSLTMFIKHA